MESIIADKGFVVASASTALDDLLPALQRLDRLLEHAVEAAEALYGTEAATDPHRGLYVSPDEVTQLLNREPGLPLLWHEETTALHPTHSKLAHLQQAFGLSPFDLDLIVIALASELDLRYERLYAFLQDDVSRKRPTVDLALNLLCPDVVTKLARRLHFAPDAPLIQHGLLHLIPDPQQIEPPLLSHYLKLDEQITRFLLGQSGLDARLTSCCEWIGPNAQFDSLPLQTETIQGLQTLAESVKTNNTSLCLYFHGPDGCGQRAAAEALANSIGRFLLIVNLSQALNSATDFKSLLQLVWHDARLQQAVLYIEGLDELLTREQSTAYQQFVSSLTTSQASRSQSNTDSRRRQEPDLGTAGITILAGIQSWQLTGPHLPEVIVIPFRMPTFSQRHITWQTHLKTAGVTLSVSDLNVLTDRFRLTYDQIKNAVATARNAARWQAACGLKQSAAMPGGQTALQNSSPQLSELFAASRAQSGSSLASLGRKVEPAFRWGDIVLPVDSLRQLQEICNQAKYRHQVYSEWGFEHKLSLGKGLNALFSGKPGTGKTMAAEIIANELELDLYKIDLSQVVSKYIGETEKNLERIFTAAENANVILLFDEADALFGKRSEVRDAHDRYANLEIAYLLQKMEEYEGITILTTNLRQNLDEAFTRRIRFIVEFPFPDEVSRLHIWQGIWPQETPIADTVDFKQFAKHFKLAGGNIRNIALAAAFLAATENQCIGVEHLIQATKREFQKIGRLIGEEEFTQFKQLKH